MSKIISKITLFLVVLLSVGEAAQTKNVPISYSLFYLMNNWSYALDKKIKINLEKDYDQLVQFDNYPKPKNNMELDNIINSINVNILIPANLMPIQACVFGNVIVIKKENEKCDIREDT